MRRREMREKLNGWEVAKRKRTGESTVRGEGTSTPYSRENELNECLLVRATYPLLRQPIYEDPKAKR